MTENSITPKVPPSPPPTLLFIGLLPITVTLTVLEFSIDQK